jgi:hypothetical protein
MAIKLNKSNWHEFVDEFSKKLTSYGDAGNEILLDVINAEYISKSLTKAQMVITSSKTVPR